MLSSDESRMEAWRAGFAVRRDWPDGAHDFAGFRFTLLEAAGFGLVDARYWRRRGLAARPVHTVVEISVRDFELHSRRYRCKAPDCPVATDASPAADRDALEAR